jgi:hypothetical protein
LTFYFSFYRTLINQYSSIFSGHCFYSFLGEAQNAEIGTESKTYLEKRLHHLQISVEGKVGEKPFKKAAPKQFGK